MSETKLIELEKKVDAIMRGLNLLLFEEEEAVANEEVQELKSRLEDCLEGKHSEFVKLDEHRTDV